MTKIPSTSVDDKFSWMNGEKAGSHLILYLRNDDDETYHGTKVKGYYWSLSPPKDQMLF
ncbi:MAG: hypothetical protein OXC48_04515 [Endozoicomonadaceae bacterium]|nr:hypothetical protein [Endozoicomonadaceae bacterium]